MIALVADIPLTGSQIKPATKFNKARMPVVVSLGHDVAIRAACAEAAAKLPTHPYKFVPVTALPDAGAGVHVDVLAVVTSLSAPSEYKRRSDGRPSAAPRTGGQGQSSGGADGAHEKTQQP